MLVFIDESGDTGRKISKGSSHYFVICLVVFKDLKQATACDNKITLLKQQLGLPENYEFKFSKLNRPAREVFLKAVLPYSFGYFSLVINKDPRKLYGEGFKVKESFYKYSCGLVFEHAKSYLKEAIVIIDGSGSRQFKRDFQLYLRKKLGQQIRKIKIQSSHSNNLLQLADMIAGSVHRYFSQKGDKNIYRPLIKSREIKVQIWPPL